MAIPTIDFQQLLGSLRADGKLILTTLIKAAAGKKFVVDARDSPNALDFDLENDAGIVETVSIPKGSAVDASAREAAASAAAEAAAAQAEIDDHEAMHPSGGTADQTARDAASAAQAGVDFLDENAFISATPNSTGFTLGRVVGNPSVDVDLSGLAGTSVEQRVLQQDPNADADTLGKFQVDPQGNAYTTTPDVEHGTAQSADFARFTHADYIGELSGEPNPLAQTLGTYYFLIVDHKLQVTVNNALGQLEWQDADWSDILLPLAAFRGARANDAAALSHIRQNGDVYFDRHNNHIRVASNFIAGTDEHTSYESKRLARIEEVPAAMDPLFVERSTLPAVSATSPDLVYLSHGHSVGGRADAVITVGFSPNGVAGYASGEIGAFLGSINTPSPLVEVFRPWHCRQPTFWSLSTG